MKTKTSNNGHHPAHGGQKNHGFRKVHLVIPIRLYRALCLEAKRRKAEEKLNSSVAAVMRELMVKGLGRKKAA